MFKTVFSCCILLAAIGLFYACKPSKTVAANENLLEKLMQANPNDFAAVLANKDSMRVQIVYTRIDRDKQNRPHFTDYFFNTNPGVYFYPASTVKMPVAFLAMEKANKLGIPINASMITEKGQDGLSAVYNDPTTPDGRPTLAHYVKKIFLVSDNDANNRLYEFLGQQYLHDQLKAKGYPDAEIVRRLAIAMPESLHRITNPVRFLDAAGKTVYEQPLQNSKLTYRQRHDFLGKGYVNDENQLVSEPMDFSRKNNIYLFDLHKILRSVMFPQAVPEKERFNFKEEDYKFLYQYMSQFPAETSYPAYDSAHFYDAYCKFLLFGTKKNQKLPKHIRSFNKVGWSYGFLTDVAYIVDFEKKVEFMLSATIYCNNDGILNDDKYDYETVGLPFMEKLGQTIYAYEVKRKRKQEPDLSAFKVNYDQ